MKRFRARHLRLDFAAHGLDGGVDDLVGHGRAYDEKDLPVGLRELLADPDWAPALTPPWVETLLGIEHNGRHLDTKQEFLEAFLALRRILGARARGGAAPRDVKALLSAAQSEGRA